MRRNVKYLMTLFVGLFLLPATSFALSFGIDINNDGSIDTGNPAPGYVNYLNTASWAAIDLSLNNLNVQTGIGTGTFNELAAIKVSSDASGGNFPIITDVNNNPVFYELTAVFEGAGNFSATFGSTITDHAFNFTSGTIKMYAQQGSDYGLSNNSNGFFGADNGTQIASFTLSYGNGTLESNGGSGAVIDNVQTWSLDTSVVPGYFFTDAGQDFATLTALANVFIQLHTNDTNEQFPESNIYASRLESEITEAIGAGKYLDMDNPDATARIYVGTSGKAFFEVVPEPTTMILFGLGLIGFAGIGRKKINPKN